METNKTVKQKEQEIKDAGYVIRRYKNVFGETCLHAIGDKYNYYGLKIEYLHNLIFNGEEFGIRYTR